MTTTPRAESVAVAVDVPGRRRRALQIALGIVWLLDAALQYQPYMFTKAFVRQVIVPTTVGNPGWIARSERWAASIMVHHIVPVNAAFATIQLVIALAILWRPTARLGLAASVAWSLGVWWFGEGLGGVLLGASPLGGEPGGVILYALLAILVWPRKAGIDEPVGPGASVATVSPLRSLGARGAWIVLWGSSAYFFLLSANRAPGVLRQAFATAASGEPGWLSSIDHATSRALAGSGTDGAVVMAACCIAIALTVLVPAAQRGGVVLAVALGLFIWFAEGFGGILTGQGTDPSSGPLLVLLALAFWPSGTRARDALPARTAPAPRSAPADEPVAAPAGSRG